VDPADGLEAALTDLLNAFLASGHTAILVLQNYHVIKHPAIHRAMGWMLDYLPPNVHLLIISASEPPIPNLARLRVRRQLTELRLPGS
jgi:LuxR family maltose regulon positive regulatory protein